MDSREVDPSPCELDAATLQRLTDLVARAHARTSASGVAIALVEDDDLVTCAAFGASAPEVGTRSPIDGSLSGRCARSGEMVNVTDVTTDERVNGEACASAGIYSIVLVPVSESGKTRGVLAAFSDRPNSFSPSQLTVLNTFAEIANELLHHRDQAASGEEPTPVASVTDPSAKCETVLHDVLSAYEAERRAKQEAAKTAPKPPSERTRVAFSDVELPALSMTAPDTARTTTAAARLSEPTAPAVKPLTVARFPETTVPTNDVTTAKANAPVITPIAAEIAPEKPGPRIVRPMATRGAAATQMALVPEPVKMPEPIIRPEPPKRDSSRPKDDSGLLSFAADPMPTKPGPGIGNPKAERSSPMQEKALFSNYDTPPAKSGSGAMKFVVGGMVALVLAGGVFGYTLIAHQPRQVMPAPPVHEQPAPVTTPEPVAAAPVSTAPVASSTPVTMPTQSSEARALAAASQVAQAQHKQETATKVTHEEPAEKIDPLTIKQPNASAKKKPLEIPEVEAPTLTAGLAAGKMPEFHSTVLPPKADFPIASVTAPKLLNGPRPVFPAAAKALRVQGDTVVLNAKVMTNGRVGDISVVRGHPVFVEAVKDAVKRWQYTPAQLNGQPTEATIEIVFKFGQQ